VRRELSLDEPVYSGITSIEANIRLADHTVPELSARIGLGSYFALGDGKALMAQRQCNGDIRVSAAFAVSEDWLTTCGIDFSDSNAARAALQSEFAGWAGEVQSIWDAVEDSFIPRPYYRLPYLHRWETRAGVTLLGDAAHVMTPFAGQGANLAMLDAVDLADCLCDAGFAGQVEALQAFEDKMCIRSGAAALETQKNQELFFGPRAAERVAELMQGHHG
jgi:2-polyprenyl-6-methoxyphenol hydroxylase-like FAD-dependent oxidoreductase